MKAAGIEARAGAREKEGRRRRTRFGRRRSRRDVHLQRNNSWFLPPHFSRLYPRDLPLLFLAGDSPNTARGIAGRRSGEHAGNCACGEAEISHRNRANLTTSAATCIGLPAPSRLLLPSSLDSTGRESKKIIVATFRWQKNRNRNWRKAPWRSSPVDDEIPTSEKRERARDYHRHRHRTRLLLLAERADQIFSVPRPPRFSSSLSFSLLSLPLCSALTSLLPPQPTLLQRFFETFSYLPPLSDADVAKQVDYITRTDPPRLPPRHVC